MIRRTMDAAFLNAVANHPDVRPGLGGEGPIDLTQVVADPANFALACEWGGFFVQHHEAGTYEAHTLFLPEGRGARAVGAIRRGLRYLFAATPCVEVVTKVPPSNRPASLLVRRMGFEPRFQRDSAWIEADGSVGPLAYFGLSLDRWTALDEDLPRAGAAFHERLEAAKRAAGSSLPVHPDDAAHDRAVGAAALMMAAGNADKAVWSYNRWARLAGYQTIELMSRTPIVVDIGDAVIEVRATAMEVLTCR